MIFYNRKQIINNGSTNDLKKARNDVLDILKSSLDAVNPYNCVKSRFEKHFIISKDEKIDTSRFKNIYLLGIGKASTGMAKAVCDSLDISKGVVVTNKKDDFLDYPNISFFIGGHPIPNNGSIKAADEAIKLIKSIDEDDLLIVLISGGGSALFSKPRVSLKDMQATTDLLLKSGANINEINTIRKHLSFVKGGQIASLAKCSIVSLVISDIINDPLQFIASGPTYPDDTTFQDAYKILKKYDLLSKVPNSALKVIRKGIDEKIKETPKKDNPLFKKVKNLIVANNKIACEKAEEKAKKLGYTTLLLTTSLDGEARDVGKYLVEKTKNFESKKSVFIAGGETTVTIKGNGEGGRNQEMVLGAIDVLSGENIVFSSFGTDGIDGNSDAAGAIADGHTLKKVKNKRVNYKSFLKNNDSYNLFKKLDDLLITGPTGTNVMDIQVIIKTK